MRTKTARRRRALGFAVAAVAVAAATLGTASASPSHGGFVTAKPAMLAPVAPGVTVQPLLTVGDTVGGYRFESIPDGIAVNQDTNRRVDVYVNHETSLVPFPLTGPTARADFTNAMVSKLSLDRRTGGTVSGSFVIPDGANYQRFCSNFLVGDEQGFERDLLLIGEEARDWVNRTGPAWPATPFAPGAEQTGVVVAYDVKTGAYRSIYGMGRHNHENAVAVPGYGQPVVLSGDDTFDAPGSQLYLYNATSGRNVWNDNGKLYALVPDDPAINDYGDLTSSNSVSGHFIEVPRMIATGKKPDGSEVRSSDFGYAAPPGLIPDGPQWVLESWSNANNVFQFIRIEDIAYDREHPNVVYLADTGEPRAIPDATTGRLRRGSTATGPYPNGRIFKLVLDKRNKLVVTSLSILPHGNFDLGGYGNAAITHQPDNLETTENALLVTEDPGSHNQYSLPEGPGKTSARVWRFNLNTGAAPDVVLKVDQSSDPTGQRLGNWESSGIVDASDAFGEGTFLIDVQAHGWEIDKQINPTPPYNARESGQLLLVKIPGT
ncbi:MAG: hypothetical protein M3R70_10570 [Actinomycetota bacterium]|nr:hypothetical protein [Actinomycetota bacterium]